MRDRAALPQVQIWSASFQTARDFWEGFFPPVPGCPVWVLQEAPNEGLVVSTCFEKESFE